MRSCASSCAHRRFVLDYIAERDRQAAAAEAASHGRWEQVGTALQLYRPTIRHDDAPWQRHVVSVSPPADRAEWEAARLAIVAEIDAAHPL